MNANANATTTALFGGGEAQAQSGAITMVMPPRGYKALCIANLLSSSIASVLCLFLIVAMTVPLVHKNRRRRYSTYNLYLAFMALPDLVHHVLVVCLVLSHEQWNPHPYDPTVGAGKSAGEPLTWVFDYRWDHSVSTMAVAANLYVNAFLTRELYGLLRSSKQRKKHPPPTLARVAVHALVSYCLGGLIFVVPWIILQVFGHGATVAIVHSVPYFVFVTLYVAVIPLSVVAVLSTLIARGDLLPASTGRTAAAPHGRLRVLVVYFGRIVLSDLLLWIPAVVLYYVATAAGKPGPTKIVAHHVSLLFTALQSIALFGCSLAKPDARRLMGDLLWCRLGRDDDESEHDDATAARGRRTSSSLGRLTGRYSVATTTAFGISLETSGEEYEEEDENDDCVENHSRLEKDTEDNDECEDLDIEAEREGARGDNPGEP